MDILKQFWFWGVVGAIILIWLGHKEDKKTTVQGAVDAIDRRLSSNELTPSDITSLQIKRKALNDL